MMTTQPFGKEVDITSCYIMNRVLVVSKMNPLGSIKRKVFQIRNMSSYKHSSYIRTAHASEIFRASFYDSRNSNVSVSIADLDELIASHNIRPSLLINGFECAGKSLGMLSKLIPKEYGELVTNVVDDATIQHFNDSIGNMQEANSNDSEDEVRETLKFHRDIHSNDDNNKIKATNVMLTAGLYKILDLTKTL